MATDERDYLTGLLTRRSLDEALAASFGRATATRPASLVMADVDHFKKINDGRGHQVGDVVLSEVGRRLSEAVEGKGLTFRYGGEEFAVVLQNHSVEEAVAVAERARKSVEAVPAAGIAITCSFGISVVPVHASSIDEWLKRADQALYEAKGLGRNLVRVVGEPKPETRSERKPVRKAPEVGGLSDEAKEKLRLEIFGIGRALCPVDHIPLDHYDVSSQQEAGRSFLVNCPGCGFSADLPGPGRR